MIEFNFNIEDDDIGSVMVEDIGDDGLPTHTPAGVIVDDKTIANDPIQTNAWNVAKTADSYKAIKDNPGEKAPLYNALSTTTDTVSVLLKSLDDYDTRSMQSRARDSTLEFPVYMSQSIPSSIATIVSNFFERYFFTKAQEVFSQDQMISDREVNNLSFLKKYHTNIREGVDAISEEEYKSILINEYYEPIDRIDKILQDSKYNVIKIPPTLEVAFRLIPSTNERINFEAMRQSRPLLDGFDYLVEDISAERKAAINAAVPDADDNSRIDDDTKKRMAIEKYKSLLDSDKDAASKMRDHFNKTNLQNADHEHKKELQDREPLKPPKLLDDNKIQKINSMAPLTFEVQFRIYNSTTHAIERPVTYVLGIHTVLRKVDICSTLKDQVYNIVTGTDKNLQKVRYKSGEISLKDYLFNTDELKADARSNMDYGKKWLPFLKRNGDYHKTYGSLINPLANILGGRGTIPIPNVIMVMTQGDVNYLKDTSGVDLMMPVNAIPFSRNTFLIALVVIDVEGNTMRVLFDDATNWEYVSLNTISAEEGKTQNSEIIKAVNKMLMRA